MLIKNIFTKELERFKYLADESSIVINGDSLSVIDTIKDCCIDLIFADPPYGIGKDFGNKTDIFNSQEDYFLWAKEWIDKCMRVLKDNGTMYFMSSTQNMPRLDVYVGDKYNIVSRIVWIYDSSGVQSKKKYGSLYEPILMITKNDKSKYTFNYEYILVEAKTGAKRKLMDYRKTPPQPYNTKKVPGNVWEFSRVRYKMNEYENHPTQKPKELLKRIILASSNEGDIVFDPFSGSFTTSDVAKELGRKSVGVEINEEYYKIGLRRTGLATKYKGEKLKKDKSRKTTNKSKLDHMNNVNTSNKALFTLTEV